MKYETRFDLAHAFGGSSGLFSVAGSFGIIDGTVTAGNTVKTGDAYIYDNGTVRLTAAFTVCENGACLRRDTLTNLTGETMTVTRLFSRFAFDGRDYEVYTQSNAWQHENRGGWQPLVTAVTAACTGIRTCDGATPVLALRNLQNRRTNVFHLVPNCQWKMSAQIRPLHDQKDVTVIETGMEDSGLALTVAPGETIDLPMLIFFETDDAPDLGAHLLHEVCRTLLPQRTLPVLYNTWLLDFDRIHVDDILRQIDCAAKLGVEMFMIDAGWFGSRQNWWECIGDWQENMTGGFAGRLLEVSDAVRAHGMTFGLWLEPERALRDTPIVREHPEYFLSGIFLDFGCDAARDTIFRVTCDLIDRYHIGFMKFDFNDTVAYDPSHGAFYRYLAGQRKFVQSLRERYPDLYLTNCAAGGHRIDLGQAMLFDSFWLSDNQGLQDSLRIFTDIARRMPPSVIEKWSALTYGGSFPEYGSDTHRQLPLSCNNATWDLVMNVKPSYHTHFLTGGPIGFSCSIADFPEEVKTELTATLAAYKRDRAFYATASLRILCDRDSVTAFAYASPDLSRIIVQVFTHLIFQESITVYPPVTPGAVYAVGTETRTAEEISADGITFPDLEDREGHSIVLTRLA